MTEKHPVAWWEIASKDAPSTVEFFRKVFGWELKYDEKSTIYEHPAEGGSENGFCGGGIFNIKPGGVEPHMTFYVRVDDVDAMVEKIKAKGGEIYVEPTKFPGVQSRICLFKEPGSGMIISLLGPKTGSE